MKSIRMFVWERRSSFVFTIGSIVYGAYHFFKPSVLNDSGAYEVLNFILGLLTGRYFGLFFIVIGSVMLYGIITNHTQLSASLYFGLVFLWLLLCAGFFVSFMQGNDNTAWITTLMIVGLSTNIITAKSITFGREMDD